MPYSISTVREGSACCGSDICARLTQCGRVCASCRPTACRACTVDASAPRPWLLRQTVCSWTQLLFPVSCDTACPSVSGCTGSIMPEHHAWSIISERIALSFLVRCSSQLHDRAMPVRFLCSCPYTPLVMYQCCID